MLDTISNSNEDSTLPILHGHTGLCELGARLEHQKVQRLVCRRRARCRPSRAWESVRSCYDPDQLLIETVWFVVSYDVR